MNFSVSIVPFVSFVFFGQALGGLANVDPGRIVQLEVRFTF